MRYNEELVDEIRQRNDIVDVISNYVNLKRRGQNYVGLCPFHNEKTGSFSVNGSRQIFKCFGCGEGGNVFSFIMKYENLTFPEAVKNLADRAGVELPEVQETAAEKRARDKKTRLLEMNKDAANYFYYQLRQPQGEAGRRYFAARKLSEETQKTFALGFANISHSDLATYLKGKGYSDREIVDGGLAYHHEKYGLNDKFFGRVMFPIQDMHGKVIGFGGRVLGEGEPKYLNSPETIVFDKSRNLYGLNFARTSRRNRMILCEGYMDVIAMHQAGFTEAVASLGTAFTSGQASLLRRYTEKVILAYDSDGAGIKAALKAIDILRSVGLESRILHLEPYKDPDEFIKAEGTEAFEKRLGDSEDSFTFELRMLQRDYEMDVPESKAKFRKAVVEKLCQLGTQFEDVEPFIELACSRYRFGYEEMVKSVAASSEQVRIKLETRARQASEADKRQEIRRGELEGKKAKRPDITNQKLLLTWLVDEPDLYGKIGHFIGVKDFSNPYAKEAASKVFTASSRGEAANPSAIMASLQATEGLEDEDYKEIASLFSTRIADGVRRLKGNTTVDVEKEEHAFLDTAEKERALRDILIGVKKEMQEQLNAKEDKTDEDFRQAMALMKEIQALSKMRLSL